MASPTPLKDTDLIDCARANAKSGVATAAELCGYGNDIKTFQQELKHACDRINVKFTELSDLITDQQDLIRFGGEIVAPDSPSEL
ncbi:hypothetical protein H6F77_07235 [Microcoleus sp. FACHB-831]|jgi:hypothetical protein|uniref:hypothetical protein n=1 Tax=Microcoleus sp. FACHB-831 TaxID=2692827 RepID=UPI001683DA97|nr:hypothetical protein [Microcoleus sp. FACHB-831]MBD1920878.1 hypothetical protein [Microcoleus sp. FACHB-831]